MVQLNELPSIAIILVVAVLVIGAGALALDAFSSSVTTDSYAYNVTENGLLGLDNTTAQFPTIGTIIGVVILIGLVVAGFQYFRTK